MFASAGRCLVTLPNERCPSSGVALLAKRDPLRYIVPEGGGWVAHPMLPSSVLGRCVVVPEVTRSNALRADLRRWRWCSWLCAGVVVGDDVVSVGVGSGFIAGRLFIVASMNDDHNVGYMIGDPFPSAFWVRDPVIVSVGFSCASGDCAGPCMVVV